MKVLRHGGRLYFPLGSGYGRTFLADGTEMQEAAKKGWFWTDSEPKVVTAQPRPFDKTVSWKLRADFPPTDRYPVTLTLDEYGERVGDYDEESGSDPATRALYEPVTETITPDAEVIGKAPWIFLDGEPAPDDGLQWVPDLPYELREHPEYGHLFPGKLVGFREAVKEALDAIPNVNAYDQGGEFSVYVKVPYEKPYTVFDRGPRGGRKKREVATRTESLKLHPPRYVQGAIRAEAVAEWAVRLEEYVTQVKGLASVRFCTHCKGTGVAP